jgi:penicillin-binding protein 1C
VGTDRFAERLRGVGLDSVKESGDYYGFSLALGSADVTLLALTNAYRALANGGNWSAPSMRPAASAVAPRRVMSAAVSHVVSDILSDQAARGVAFGMGNALDTPFWTAVKTGTSKDMRDNWTIGYSSRYTVGVWVGNASGSPMHDVSGVSGAAPVWRDVMLHLHKKIRSEPPAVPAGIVAQEIRYEPPVEPARREMFMSGSERDVIRLALLADGANLQARIASPVAGSVIALDPDIPPANQRLQFIATAPGAARWELDGKIVGTANRSMSWFPMPGTHRLRLINGRGEILDEAVFEVRGAQVRATRLTTFAKAPQ